MNTASSSIAVPSPCNSVCTIDNASGLCIGCFRTLDEIANWINLGAAQRRAVVDALPARRARADAATPDGER